MKKVLVVILVFSVVFLSGCFNGKPHDIPAECLSFESDHCALFECMAENCWCDDIAPKGAILEHGNSAISSKEDAIAIVQQHVQNTGSDYHDVRSAVQLNTHFWNVFAFNSENGEMVFTVANDGTIMKTICGV